MVNISRIQSLKFKALSSFRSYTFDAQILCNNDGRFLSDSYRSVIGISSYIARCDTEI